MSENQLDTVHVRYQVQLRFARTAIEAELVNLNQYASQQVVAKVFINMMSSCCVVLSFYFDGLNFVSFCLMVLKLEIGKMQFPRPTSPWLCQTQRMCRRSLLKLGDVSLRQGLSHRMKVWNSSGKLLKSSESGVEI